MKDWLKSLWGLCLENSQATEQRRNEGSLEHTDEVRLTFRSSEEGDLAAGNAIAAKQNSIENKFVTTRNAV